MSDIQNTTFVAARAASKYLGSSPMLGDQTDTVVAEVIGAHTELQVGLGVSLSSTVTCTTSPVRGIMGYGLVPAMVTAATFAALGPTPVSLSKNWKAIKQSVVVYDRRDKTGVVRSTESTIADKVVLELARLKNGWAGEGSMAPPKATIKDVGAVLDLLPISAAMPLVEVEEDDGTVSLRWLASDGQRSFSLVCRGSGRVTGVVATINPPRSSPWSAAVSDEVQIASKLEEQIASGIFVG
ncbi:MULTISPECIES: hypothetical protein [Bradyrhizobium]|jgi:hypothetical protein|uniref:hypothetical protein n=1 Tax=Bradyrhizobium TaxID=374 RepID=UPI00056F69F3|nr:MULTISPECIES: hypothetical protein [Bradyrhizobium]MDI2109516.1 hypothetical protein [Bradyrhizobium sp. Mp64]WLB04507.1 hypothetical protein QNJ80_21945 [Bradyrhizobium elkanii]